MPSKIKQRLIVPTEMIRQYLATKKSRIKTSHQAIAPQTPLQTSVSSEASPPPRPDFKGLSQELSFPIQAKLTVGEPNDKYEQEADRVAEQVIQQINTPQISQGDTDQIQRQEDKQPTQITPLQWPQLQRKSDSIISPFQNNLETSINGARGMGKPLPKSLRPKMENVFGSNFNHVRIHDDSRADHLNQSLQAKAFTTGQDIFFRKGQYQPSTRSGQKLLAHELTHVTQQNNQTSLVQRMSLMIGDLAAEQRAGQSRFLEDEKDHLESVNELGRFIQIRDKWGEDNRGVHGPKRSYNPSTETPISSDVSIKRFLAAIQNTEDLKIIAHGSPRGLFGGYKPIKLIRMLVSCGLDPDTYTGDIYLCGCVTAYRADPSDEGSSYIEKLHAGLQEVGFTSTEVYGIKGIAASGGEKLYGIDPENPDIVALKRRLDSAERQLDRLMDLEPTSQRCRDKREEVRVLTNIYDDYDTTKVRVRKWRRGSDWQLADITISF